MINSYCRVCGLYISVGEEFARGMGKCPRCQQTLRIPAPLTEDSPLYQPGLRYLTESPEAQSASVPEVPSQEYGQALRYTCPKCGKRFESLHGPGLPQGQCPHCEANATTPDSQSEFPRSLTGQVDELTKPIEAEENEMKGEAVLEPTEIYYVAPVAKNTELTESVVLGVTLTEEEAAGTRNTDALDPMEETPTETDWCYMLKGQRHGPVTTVEMRQLLRSGRVTRSVLIWQEGMDGWQPLERVEMFEGSTDDTPVEDVIDGEVRSTKKQMASLSRHGMYFLWGGVAAVGLSLLLYVMRTNLAAMGEMGTMTADIGLAVLALAATAAGCIEAGVKWGLWKQMARGAQTQFVVGMMLLLGVGTMSVGMARTWSPPIVARDYSRVIAQAEAAYQAMLSNDHDAMLMSIEWRNLTCNGIDVGKAYTESTGPEQRAKLESGVAVPFAAFVTEATATGPAGPWRVQEQFDGKTFLVRALGEDGANIQFILNGGKLEMIATEK